MISARPRLGRTAALVAMGLLTPACTVIKVDGGKTTIAPGLLQVVPEGGNGLIAVRRQSYGLDAGSNKLVIGYSQEQFVTISDNSTCAIIVFQSALSDQDRSFFRELAESNKSICLQ